MQAAYKCGRYHEGVEMFERLQEANAPITLPVYSTAIQLYGKLGRQEEVKELWQQVVSLDLVSPVNAGVCITAFADNGNITGAKEVLGYMKDRNMAPNVVHYSSAINACANSLDASRGRDAELLLEEMVEMGLEPNIVTYTSVLGAMRESPGEDMLNLLAKMKACDVRANKVFAERFFFTFLREPCKGRWKNDDDMSQDLRNRPLADLETAKEVMDDFVASGVLLSQSSRLIQGELEKLL
eukprot:Skav225895  [mRNA]  locus=scaffold1460:294930:295649:- [translate_table: standard]